LSPTAQLKEKLDSYIVNRLTLRRPYPLMDKADETRTCLNDKEGLNAGKDGTTTTAEGSGSLVQPIGQNVDLIRVNPQGKYLPKKDEM
jgi:hypothetical protein